MAITRKEKEATLSQLTEDLKNARGVVFTEYKGLSVAAVNKMRRELKKENVKYQVVKLTLLKKVLQALGIAGQLESAKPGTSLAVPGKPLAVAISQTDEAAPARLLKILSKDFPMLVLDGGILNNEMIGKDVVSKLASLPSKQQLLGQLVSVIAGPARGLVTVLSGNVRDLLNILKAIKDKKS
ncbi:MAG: 50S ribosomal protein L10 [Candidatus Doudnabacteria bacterium]|nr:50S ribosomal protein L10 [Candidatus Doudnabacteria bacterium]